MCLFLVLVLVRCGDAGESLLKERVSADGTVTSLEEILTNQSAYVLFFGEETCSTCIEKGLVKMNGLQKETQVYVFCFKGGLTDHWQELYPSLEFLSTEFTSMSDYFGKTSDAVIIEYRHLSPVRKMPVGL